jgi:cell shape-determining protein MreC
MWPLQLKLTVKSKGTKLTSVIAVLLKLLNYWSENMEKVNISVIQQIHQTQDQTNALNPKTPLRHVPQETLIREVKAAREENKRLHSLVDSLQKGTIIIYFY